MDGKSILFTSKCPKPMELTRLTRRKKEYKVFQLCYVNSNTNCKVLEDLLNSGWEINHATRMELIIVYVLWRYIQDASESVQDEP